MYVSTNRLFFEDAYGFHFASPLKISNWDSLLVNLRINQKKKRAIKMVHCMNMKNINHPFSN